MAVSMRSVQFLALFSFAAFSAIVGIQGSRVLLQTTSNSSTMQVSQCMFSSSLSGGTCVYNPLYAASINGTPMTGPSMLYMKLGYYAALCYNQTTQAACVGSYCSWDTVTSTCNVMAPDDTYRVLAACPNSTVSLYGTCVLADMLGSALNCSSLSGCTMSSDGHCTPSTMASMGMTEAQLLTSYYSGNTSIWSSCVGQGLFSNISSSCLGLEQASCSLANSTQTNSTCVWDNDHGLCLPYDIGSAATTISLLSAYNDTFSTLLSQQISSCSAVNSQFPSQLDSTFTSTATSLCNSAGTPANLTLANISSTFYPYSMYDINAVLPPPPPTPVMPPPQPPPPSPPPSPFSPPPPYPPSPPPLPPRPLNITIINVPAVNPAVVLVPVACVGTFIVLVLLVIGLVQTRNAPLTVFGTVNMEGIQMPKMPNMSALPQLKFGTGPNPGSGRQKAGLEFNALPPAQRETEGSGLLAPGAQAS